MGKDGKTKKADDEQDKQVVDRTTLSPDELVKSAEIGGEVDELPPN
jgi:hypothetical protein